MRPTPVTLKLPAKLVDELGGHATLSPKRKPHHNVSSRKDRRKTNRVQKKAQRSGPPPLKRQRLQHSDHKGVQNSDFRVGDHHPRASPPREPTLEVKTRPKSILKTTKLPNEPAGEIQRISSSPPLPGRFSRNFAAKLEQDDAEITALEKKLGIEKRKKLPQSFKDDGLDDLLEGLDGSESASSQLSNADQVAKDWLAKKRSFVNVSLKSGKGGIDDVRSSREGVKAISETLSDEDSSCGYEDGGLNQSSDAAVDSENDFEGFSSELDENPRPLPPPRRRENPYIAPASQEGQTSLKYVPPSLRNQPSNSEDLVRLRRQIQGLINRLTEVNLISILGHVEELYLENARQYVTSTLVDLLLISVCEPATLPDTLIILPAGFMTAVYKVIGTDFGAQVIERLVELFDEHYDRATKAVKSRPVGLTFDSSKETSNLITLLAELYNFQVIGSNLIFDYIRMFLQTLSELNTELLLRIIRTSGPQLRQDDPSSLRDIVAMLRPAVADLGEQNLSVRTRFMIESINDLKNNHVKTGAAAFSVISEHTVRMKKTIGTLNSRSARAYEPLRIGLKDIRESDKRGKWWLVGASWAGNTSNNEKNKLGGTLVQRARDYDSTGAETGPSDLVHLAREQRMNTDIRRAIFVTIMSASDYQDAYLRLMKLKLKKVQELEIPKVIIHCSSAEKHYNPYYTLIAKKLCSDRKLRMAFQFNLWDIFRRLGDANENDDVVKDAGDEEILDLRQLVNHAKMFGGLIVGGGISFTVLKNLNLRYLQPKTKMFVEVLLVTVLLHTQLQSPNKRDEQAVRRVFLRVKDMSPTIRGLQYFLKRVLTKTDIAGGKAELATVRWASKVAASVLDSLLVADITKA